MNKTLKVDVGNLNKEKGVLIVKFEGEFDKAGFSHVADELNALVKDCPAKILVFDFKNLKFINSEGIGYLMEVHSHLAKVDKRLVVFGVNDHVKDVFKAIGLYDVIEIHESLPSSLS